jgi:uncharacterized protein
MRIPRSWFGVLAGAMLMLATASADDRQPIPHVARVTDIGGTLDDAQKKSLDAKLSAFEQRKGSQIAVLVIPTTQPEDIEQYSIRVADQWKLGRKDVDDGVLITVATTDHKVRIEVGKGLEGAITDVDAGRIIREYMTPKFRANDYYGGIDEAADALMKLIDGEPLPPPMESNNSDGDTSALSLIPNALIFGFVLSAFFSGVPRLVRAFLIAALLGGMGWLVSHVILKALGMSGIGFALGLVVGRGGFFGGSGFGSGGGGGFSSGGGGGGFSGGGGGFSGGGASGSW